MNTKKYRFMYITQNYKTVALKFQLVHVPHYGRRGSKRKSKEVGFFKK